jgi:hypothetical protein
MLSLKGLMPVMLGAGLSTVMFLGFLSYGRRSENYKIGRNLEEQVEQVLRRCLSPNILLESDVKIKYGNIDFLLVDKKQVIILEVKAGKLRGERLKNTYDQIQADTRNGKDLPR